MTRRAAARIAAALAALALAVTTVGCGDAGQTDELVVSAAASLSEAFPVYAENGDYGSPRFSFAGSDELAAQIRQGGRPDVYAAANTDLLEQLHDEGLLERPTAFARNELVLAVPAGADAVHSLADVAQPGMTLAIGDPEVPVGSYTREVLDRLPKAESEAILANVASSEPDVLGITGKLTQGAVEAGFVYASDVEAADGDLEAIELPERLRPDVAYAAAVVRGSDNPEAEPFVDGLLSKPGQHALREAGFLPPP